MSLKSLMERWARDIGNTFYMSVSDVLGEDVGADFVDPKPSNSPSLRIRTGGLLRSFLPTSKKGLFSYSSSEKGLQVVVGSQMPYAKIHETGGRIYAKRTKFTKRGIFWSMSLFFLAKYYQTKVPYFFNLFLAVQKKGFVTIPRRAYFSKAAKVFQQKHYPRLLGKFVQQLLKEWAKPELSNETE